MRFFVLWGWAAAILLSGCAAEKHYTVTDTDTKNGTVRLSYNLAMFERPEVATSQPLYELAWQECMKLGYTMVKVQPKQETRCLEKSHSGDYCVNTLVSRVYQCAGGQAGKQQREQKALKAATSTKQPSQSLRYLYYAEKLAREHSCSTALKPESVSPAEEVYSTVCDGKQAFIACNRAGCSL